MNAAVWVPIAVVVLGVLGAGVNEVLKRRGELSSKEKADLVDTLFQMGQAPEDKDVRVAAERAVVHVRDSSTREEAREVIKRYEEVYGGDVVSQPQAEEVDAQLNGFLEHIYGRPRRRVWFTAGALGVLVAIAAIVLVAQSIAGDGEASTGARRRAIPSTVLPTGQKKSVDVKADEPSQDTGIDLRGQVVAITARGEISDDPSRTAQRYGPEGAGNRQPDFDLDPYSGDPNRGCAHGALTYRIGRNAQVACVPLGQKFVPPAGRLFLGVNDDEKALQDNTGEFSVLVEWAKP